MESSEFTRAKGNLLHEKAYKTSLQCVAPIFQYEQREHWQRYNRRHSHWQFYQEIWPYLGVDKSQLYMGEQRAWWDLQWSCWTSWWTQRLPLSNSILRSGTEMQTWDSQGSPTPQRGTPWWTTPTQSQWRPWDGSLNLLANSLPSLISSGRLTSILGSWLEPPAFLSLRPCWQLAG